MWFYFTNYQGTIEKYLTITYKAFLFLYIVHYNNEYNIRDALFNN